MAEGMTLEEVEAAIAARRQDLRAEGLSNDERTAIHSAIQELVELRKTRELETYFALEGPAPLNLSGLTLEQLQEKEQLVRKQYIWTTTVQDLEGSDEEIRADRLQTLRAQLDEVQTAVDAIRREQYNPGPKDAPIFEPSGYSARAGFVKSQPGNNEFYVEQFRDNPWYEIIRRTHDRLEGLIPGYNISQIKEKYGGLRYYIDYPAVIPTKPEWPAYSTVDKIKDMVRAQITYAEGWVEGYENARRSLTEENRENQ